jgi:hypothetical protein
MNPRNGTPIELIYVKVFSDHTEPLLTDGAIHLWKWPKATSSYVRKNGFWRLNTDAAVTDGKWYAGRDLRLLVRAVSEEWIE